MYKFQIYFSEEEVIGFLESRGYTVCDFGVWRDGDDVEETDIITATIKVAHKNDLDPLLTEFNDWFNVSNKVGISTVFDKEMKKKLLFN